ncbi:MAG TPA: putative ABC exporter domain-containing protein [Planctomycetota bacterium]
MRSALGAPALNLLLRLKLRGMVRRQVRRLRTPKGFVLTLVGAGAFAAWIASLTVASFQPIEPLSGHVGELRVRAFGALLLLVSLSTALTNRGLYLPKAEIERLFSAPLARADLVRYRLLAGGLRSLLGGVVLGLFGARRLPNPPLAFAGIVLAMQILPVINQFVAIALGGIGQRASRLARRVGTGLLLGSLAAAGLLALSLASGRGPSRVPVLGTLARALDGGEDPLLHPLLGLVTAPLLPWVRAVMAETPGEFLPWFVLCLGLFALASEVCARLPVDFRELSLATSARAAARLSRARAGGGASATRADRSLARYRIPWLFGRGPAGAIAWRKCAGMARKAKGALWIALLALAFLVLFVDLFFDGPERALGAPVMIATLGTIYLCSGLRFDFREELERMDIVRAWPLHPARVFLAMLLPEVVLVAALLSVTVVLEAAARGTLGTPLLGVIACLPFLVFAWVALDNLVFLIAPVRHVPGQDGLVQNAGRRMIQMALLALLALLTVGLAWLAFLPASALARELGAGPGGELAAGTVAVLVVLLAVDAVLVFLGGFVLRSFDVARDRG